MLYKNEGDPFEDCDNDSDDTELTHSISRVQLLHAGVNQWWRWYKAGEW